jgi:SET domain-containing protein
MSDSRSSNRSLGDIVYVGDSGIHGRGLFASREIARGEYIGTFTGPTAKKNGSHVLWIYADDGTVTGRRGRNLLRFVNHALPCNAVFDGFDLYSLKRIRRDEEITIDYGWSE